jgi:carboxypeptidase Q
VIGEIPGTDLPNEYVMLSAHYDSWEGGSGATDNRSGSLLMLETMRILTTVYPNPKRTILIGLWSGEEQGLNGSRAFTEDHPEVIEGLQALFNQDNGTGRIVNLGAQGFTRAGARSPGGCLRYPPRWRAKSASTSPGTRAAVAPTTRPSCATERRSSTWGHCLGTTAHTRGTPTATPTTSFFDDLKNNVVLTATLVYMASEDPERVSRERRTVITGRGGRPGQWPTCSPANRNSPNGGRP